jgi:hypothetical protein
MRMNRDVEMASLEQAVEMFKENFAPRYPEAQFLIDGEGYEDEDLDLNIYVDGDEVEIGIYASEISTLVQEQTGYFILPFVLPVDQYPFYSPESTIRRQQKDES